MFSGKVNISPKNAFAFFARRAAAKISKPKAIQQDVLLHYPAGCPVGLWKFWETAGYAGKMQYPLVRYVFSITANIVWGYTVLTF
ncbi:MAG: hypothetical protein ABH865_02850, partial [Candidatus Omnitrophota bacterium]